MGDNAWPHRTHAVQQLLEREDITRLDWPAYSPNLNPIEHMWDALGKHISRGDVFNALNVRNESQR